MGARTKMVRWLWVLSLGCGETRTEDAFPVSSSASATLGDGGTGTGTGTGSLGTGADETAGSVKLDVGAANPDLGGGVVGGCDDLSGSLTNQGCEFWAVDLPNVSVVPPFTIDTVPADQQFAVVVTNPSAEQAATVEIFGADPVTPIVSGPVPTDTMRVFELPAQSITPGATTANGQAYRIVSDAPIIAYQFQPLDNTTPVFSNDATLLFPTHVLTGDYTAITGDATLATSDAFGTSDNNTGAFVSVVGIADQTTVTLYPTATLFPGAFENVVLARGQVLTAISSERGAPGWGNLSGTRVIADQPVAVFAGSVATSEPSADDACCADHVEHQMLPLSAWGTQYAAAPAAPAVGAGNDPSLFRVTGAFDGTALTYDPAPPPGAPATVDAGQTVGFVTDTPFTVRAADALKPFSVGQFLLSNQAIAGANRPGDPSMILLPAAGQFQSRYVFLMPQGYDTSFVTIVRPQGTSLELDGGALPAATFVGMGALDGVDYEYAHLGLAPGSHVLDGDDPFSIIISGHAPDVSYGYAGGSGVGAISRPPPPPAG